MKAFVFPGQGSQFPGMGYDLYKSNEKVKSLLPSDVDYRRIEFVGPKVGQELKVMGLKAIVFSLIAMFIYIWIRISPWYSSITEPHIPFPIR